MPDTDRTPEEDMSKWRFGRCYAMASALGRMTGWEVGALVVDVPGPHGDRPHVVHAWVVAPDGDAYDAGGLLDTNGVRDEFLAETSRKWTNDRNMTFGDRVCFEDFLRASYGDDADWAGFYFPQVFLPQVEDASAFARDHVMGHLPLGYSCGPG